MLDNKRLIDWYIQREVRAAQKNPTHGKIFLDRILNEPDKEVAAIKVALDQDILLATHELSRVPQVDRKIFPQEVVVAYRDYFLGIP